MLCSYTIYYQPHYILENDIHSVISELTKVTARDFRHPVCKCQDVSYQYIESSKRTVVL